MRTAAVALASTAALLSADGAAVLLADGACPIQNETTVVVYTGSGVLDDCKQWETSKSYVGH